MRSSALIIVLFFVSLLSVLVLAFLGSMQLETASSRSHLNGVNAELYADLGTESGLNMLYMALQDPTSSWISQPGRIYKVNAEAKKNVAYELSSGVNMADDAATLATKPDEVVDLNPILLQNGDTLIAPMKNTSMVAVKGGDHPAMYLNWIYQLEDGSLCTYKNINGNPVGRFAYWIDDQSTRINVNTAGFRNTQGGNATNRGNPSRISLTALDPALSTTDVANLTNYTSTNSFSSPYEATRSGNAKVASAVTNQVFSLTAYNHSPDLTMKGQKRILLTTQKWLADANGTDSFIDILKTESTAPWPNKGYVDPGKLFPEKVKPAESDWIIDPDKAVTVLNKIYNLLIQTTWPFDKNGLTFISKYKTPTDCKYIALNIVDYVRSVESIDPVIQPFRVEFTSKFNRWSNAEPVENNYSVGRRLYYTEMAVWFKDKFVKTGPANYGDGSTAVTATQEYFQGTTFLKIFLPYFNSSTKVDLSQYLLGTQTFQNSDMAAKTDGSSRLSTIGSGDLVPGGGNNLQLTPGTAASVQRTDNFIWRDAPTPANPGPHLPYPTNVSLEFFLTPASMGISGHRIEIIHFSSLAVNPSIPPTADQVQSYGVEDPLVNKGQNDWIPANGASNGFKSPTLNLNLTPTQMVVGKTSTTDPEQDCDTLGGKVTRNYEYIPAPHGDLTGDNIDGIVKSVGELGFVHTGTTGVGNFKGAPFRTIHLQPTKNTSGPPDWAILDLFSAPVYVGPTVVSPTSLSSVLPNTVAPQFKGASPVPIPNRGGLVNVNARLYPFSETAAFKDKDGNILSRPLPLEALLNGAPITAAPLNAAPANTTNTASATSTPSIDTLAANIINYTTANTGKSYGTIPNLYYHPGQLAEIKGIADGGEPSEALIRDIASVASANSNVFTIYVVGQAIQKNAQTGAYRVLGERRKATTVERVVTNFTGKTAIADSKVSFRPVFSQNLQN